MNFEFKITVYITAVLGIFCRAPKIDFDYKDLLVCSSYINVLYDGRNIHQE